MGKSLLVIEDDQDIANLIKVNMQDLDFDVEVARDGAKGLELGLGRKFDMIILDISMPVMNGLEVCRRLREGGVDTPILMLTAKGAEIDRVIGLETGADDYMVKPFSVTELQARVKARIRRMEGAFSGGTGNPAQAATQTEVFRSGELVIDEGKRTVTLREEEVQLTAKEFDLLLHFARHPGRVFTREQLLDNVWGYGFEGYEHTVNSHINRLRSKVEDDPAKPRYILTVWGVGYKFSEARDVK